MECDHTFCEVVSEAFFAFHNFTEQLHCCPYSGDASYHDSHIGIAPATAPLLLGGPFGVASGTPWLGACQLPSVCWS